MGGIMDQRAKHAPGAGWARSGVPGALLFLLAAGAASCVHAQAVVVGQGYQSDVSAPLPPSTLTFSQFDLVSPAVPSATIPSWPAGREYIGGGPAAGDARGTRAYAAVDYMLGSTRRSAIVEFDALRRRINASIDLFTYEATPGQRVVDLVPDAPRGLLYALVTDGGAPAIWKIRRDPLYIVQKTSFGCDDPDLSHLAFVTVDGGTLIGSCGNRLMAVDAGTGARRAFVDARDPATGAAASLAGIAYDDVLDVVYASMSTRSTSTIVVFEPQRLDLRTAYLGTGFDSPAWVAADGAIHSMVYEFAPDLVTARLLRFDPATGFQADAGAMSADIRFPATSGRGDRLVGVYQADHVLCGSACDAAVQAFDLRTRAYTTVRIDERAVDDPTRGIWRVIPFFVAPVAQVREAVEYVRGDKDHYLVTADPSEIAALDGGAFAGWARTGQSFPVFAEAADSGDPTSPVCRYYGRPEYGLDTHFYSALPQECAAIKPMFGDAWIEETLEAFFAYPANGDGSCPNATAPVFRLYNNRSDVNHRYTTSRDIRASMMAQGWIPEGLGADGVGFCVPRG